MLTDAISQWRKELRHRIAGHNWKVALQWMVWHFGYDIPRTLAGKEGFGGQNVLDDDWEVLVILDAARFDLMKEVVECKPAYSQFEPVRPRLSVSGSSYGWMKETFGSRDLSDIEYITANPHTEALFERTDVTPDSFAHLEEVWKFGWDDDQGTVPARAITDRGISRRRTSNEKRMILHYMQPHFPSVPDPIGSPISKEDHSWNWSAWNQLKRGKISKSEVWDSYLSNLEYVLDDVKKLLENMDAAKVVITADHGNAIGERGYFGHDDWPVEGIKTVPWCVTNGVDTEKYEPELEISTQGSTDKTVEDRLSALGYR